MVCEVVDPFGQTLAFGDVGKTGNVMLNAFQAVAQYRNVHPFRVDLAIRVPVPHLALPMTIPVQELGHVHASLSRCATGREALQILSDHILGFMTGQSAEGGIDLDDAFCRVSDDDGLVVQLEHLFQPPQPRSDLTTRGSA